LIGRPRWVETEKARWQTGGNRSLTVCARTRRLLDTAENQLARYLARRLLEAAAQIPQVLRNGWVVEWSDRGLDTLPTPATELLARLTSTLSSAKRHPWFRLVPLPQFLSPALLSRVDAHRNPEYRELARLSRLLPAGDPPAWHGVARPARLALPIPATRNPEDPWVHLAAALIQRGGEAPGDAPRDD
jgi:hypothetical protein